MDAKPLRRLWPALLSSLLIAGCATYSATVGEMEHQLANGNPSAALKFLEKRDPPDRDRVLFLLDKAMLLRLTGDYAGSNASFESAKRLMERLTTASVSETAGSFLINDATQSFVGAPFEQALLHAYAALNYIDLKSLDDARVEALQVDVRLKALAEDDDGALAQDPFARYLAGMIYEAKGEESDALIAYRHAYESYLAHAKRYGATIPETLKRDLLRLTQAVGIRDEHRKYKKRFKVSSWPSSKELAADGEVIFLLHNGLAPLKQEHVTVIYPPSAPQVIKIALPFYRLRHSVPTYARLTLGSTTAQTETVENIGAIAKATLEDAMPGITARAIARAVAKHQASKKAGENSAALGLLTKIAGLATERADTRSWLTLPNEIQMARMVVPPGEHKLLVELLTAKGATLAKREFDLHVEKGKKSFLSYHWIQPLPKKGEAL